jgi:hypothetical protein
MIPVWLEMGFTTGVDGIDFYGPSTNGPEDRGRGGWEEVYRSPSTLIFIWPHYQDEYDVEFRIFMKEAK